MALLVKKNKAGIPTFVGKFPILKYQRVAVIRQKKIKFYSWLTSRVGVKLKKKAVCWSGDGSASDLTTSLQLKGIIICWKVKPVEIKKGNSNFVLVTYFSIQFFFLLSLQLTGDFASTEQAWLLRKWTSDAISIF